MVLTFTPHVRAFLTVINWERLALVSSISCIFQWSCSAPLPCQDCFGVSTFTVIQMESRKDLGPARLQFVIHCCYQLNYTAWDE